MKRPHRTSVVGARAADMGARVSVHPSRVRTTKRRRIVRATVVFAILTAFSSLVAQPASADGGQSAKEGYVMIQQALSFLVNDSGPNGAAQAIAMVDNALAAADQDGVDVVKVREAKAALQSGTTEAGRALLQDSIAQAVSALKPATGEQTGTTIMLGPLPPRATLSVLDWLFLGLSVVATLIGAALSYLFRPGENLSELRREVLAATDHNEKSSGTPSTGRNV